MNEFDQAAARVAGPVADPIDRAAAEVVGDQRTALRFSLYNSLLADPEVAARATKLGRRAGLPADVVERNLPEVQRNVQLDEFDKVLQNSPTVAQWLTDQNNAKIAHDDVPNLDALVKQYGEIKPIERTFLQEFTEPVQRGLAQGRRGLTLLFNELGIFKGLQRQRDAARIANGLPPEGNTELAVRLANQQREVERYPVPENIARGMRELSDATTMGEALQAALTNPRAVGEVTLQSLGASAPALVTAVGGSVLGPWGTATGAGLGSFAVEYGNTLQDVMAEKGVNASDPMSISSALDNPEIMAAAREKAVKRGVPIAIFDALTAGLAGKLLAGAKPTALSVGGRAAGELGLQAGGGAAGEAVAQGVTGEYKPGDILLEALGELPTAIVEVPANYRDALQRAQVAEQRAQALQKFDDLAKASKVRQRDADTFEAFVAQATADGPVQEVFIDANTLMQSGNAEAIAAVSPSVAEQLPAALATGGDIKIPIAEYTARIAGTEYSQGLLDHLKTEPSGMSRAEAQEFMQSQAQILEEEVQRTLAEKQGDEQFKAQADEVKAAVRTQLDQVARFTGNVNDAYASMVGNFYAVMGAKLGVTPTELFQRYPLQIAAEGVTGGQQFDQAGKTKIYHGTSAEAAAAIEANGFDVAKAADGTIWFTSNPNIGEVAASQSGAVVERAFDESKLKLGGWEESDKYSTDELIGMGYDGLKLVDESETTYQIFNPEKLEKVGEELNQSAAQSGLERMRAKAQAEYDAVVAQYQGTEQWMRAPNGNPTKLNERQWVQVRTPSFKAWFGDWEKAYADGGVWRTSESVSKVVDTNGEPMVVYHGTDTGGFTQFYETGGEVRGDLGIFTTSNRDMAATYVKRGRAKDIEFGEITDEDLEAPRPADGVSGIYASFANIREPYESDFEGAVWNGERPGKYQVRAENGDLIGSDSGSYYFDMFDDANQVSLANPGSEVEPADSHYETTDDVVRQARRGGNDGAVINNVIDDGGGAGRYIDEPSDVFVVFDPGQIKSADQNIGTFGTFGTDNILLQSKTDTRDLIVTHNLSADNLLHAAKMGGIPVPSLAVTKKDAPLTGFGEITLIGESALADPKGYAGTKVFGADIYSPRYPGVEYIIPSKTIVKAQREMDAAETATGERVDWDEVRRNGVRGFEFSAPMMWRFLSDRGYSPEILRNEVAPLPEAISAFAGDARHKYELIEDPAFIEAAWQAHLDLLTQAYEGDVEAARAEVQATRARAEERGVSQIVRSYADTLARYQRETREAGRPDSYRTKQAMQGQIESLGLQDEFKAANRAYLESLNPDEKIFQGFTYSGNRKYIPHTLDNVVKILKKELRGGENFNYGVGSLRAKFTPQFKSIEQIRKNKDRLVSKADFEKIKEEIDAQFWDVARAIDKDLSGDTAIAIMEDAAKMGVKRAAKSYGYDISDESAVQAAEFLTRLRELPTEYFEAKILREVDLAEFAGAVVPEGVDPKVIGVLQARGVKDIRTYKKGDEADRAAKIGEFENLFFQDKAGARGAFNPATNTITLLKNADLSTFLHESGHFFLETQFDVASRLEGQRRDGASLTPGEEQILADTSALLKWFGVRDLPEWYGLDFEVKRDYHERFARGFEAYLFEGKAPSIELQGLFQRFRAWMLNVYRELKALNVELTDEVRSVFDRMLATNEQIQLAEQGRSMMPLFTSPEQAGMTVDEFAAYQALGVDATNDAIQDVQARTLRDLAWTRNAKGREVKRLQREAAELRREVQMEVRREVMSQPVYRAWQFLTSKLSTEDKAAMAPVERPKSGKTLDETQDSLFVAIAKLGGLDRKAVESAWGWDPKERSPQPSFGTYLLRREGGLSLDAMGERLQEYGYLTPDENGKFDPAELEEKFQAEYRGELQYSMAVNPAIFGEEGRPGEGITTENVGAGRFDLVALKSLGLPEEIVQIIQDLKMTAKDGIHPDIVADLFGFTSGDELVRTLAIAQSPKVEIEGLTDSRMLERYGDLATPEAIERAADKAIHNEARARFVATEVNALAKATGQRKILTSAARDFARAMIARLKVRDIRPGQYASAEVRAAKAAQKASQSGDLTTAAAEKRNQLVNNYATRSAYDAQEEVDKGIRYINKFDNEGTRKGLEADYLDQIDALRERFDFRKGVSLKAIDKRKALAEWIQAQRDQGLEPEIPAALENEAFRKSYKDLTVEEFRGLVDTIKQIEHLGRLKNRLLTAADNRAFEAVKNEIVASIEENDQGRIADTRTPTTNLGRLMQTLKNFGASHVKAATWARILDGGKDGGPMWEYLVRSANERGNMETTMRADATVALSKILAPVFKLGKMGGSGQFFPSIGRSLNREARIALALNTGNQGNLQRLLGGEGWTVQQIQPVLESLTAAEWQAVQDVWDHFESYRPQIGAKERRVYGREPAWVDPAPFTIKTADGGEITLRGGYYPIKYDPAASQRAEEYADAEGAKRQLQGAFTSATTRRSFTKTRAEEVSGRPLLYTLAGLYSGVNDVIHDLTWHEWLIDANRILRNKAIDSAIRNAYGPAVKNQFKTWVADIAEGEKGAQNAAEQALGRLRQGVSAAGLGFNVMSAAMQVTGFNQSIVRVGAKWIGRGIAQYIADPMGKAREVVGMSEFMADRSRTQFRELNELRNRVQDESPAMRNIKLGTYFFMMRMQRMVDVPTWLGAYEKAIAGGNNEERAVALADQAVIDSQGSGMVKDLSAVERGGPALKLFTVFYSYMNTALNLGVAQTMTTKSKAKLAADYLMLFTVPVVLGTALKEALTPGGDDDDDLEKLARKLAAEQLSYLMGLMVVVREFNEVAKVVTGAEGAGRSYGGPAGLRAIGDFYRFAQQANQGEFDDAFRKAAINLLGDFTGLPAAQINRTITGTQALAEGETENPAAVLFGYQK